MVAYSPIGAPGSTIKDEELNNKDLFKESIILNLGKKYGKTPAQIILNWHLHS